MNEIPMVDLGIGEYQKEAPSSRIPVDTRGNAGEVWPDVAYPLSVSLARGDVPDPFARALLATGIRDGAVIRVDGPAGTVTVLELPPDRA